MGLRRARAFRSVAPTLRRLSLAVIAMAIAGGAVAAAGQQPAAAKPTEPEAAQQPGAGAQVHTGTSSGLDAETRFENLLADHQFPAMKSQLDKMEPEQAQFYRGILANRDNDLKTSMDLLTPLIDKVSASGNVLQEKLLRKALAEDYLRLGDWTEASKAYQALESRMQGKLSADEQDEIEMPLKLLPLAEGNPKMTVDPCDPFRLQVSRDPLGLTDIPVFVDAEPQAWLLDPTAPFNLITHYEAAKVGLKLSDRTTTIQTLTGKPIQVHMAVIPRFTVGGRLTLRDMTVFVVDDTDFYFPKSKYQMDGVLGYPALAAMGRVTVTANATVEIRPAKQLAPAEKDDLLTDGARFYLDGDRVIVALNKTRAEAGAQTEAKPDDERMFEVDAGGQRTYLTARYFDEHAGEFSDERMELFAVPGENALPPQPAYIAETVPLTVGKTTVQVHYLPVLTQPLGAAGLDDVYGVLGVDVLDQLKSFTFDYRTMRFAVAAE